MFNVNLSKGEKMIDKTTLTTQVNIALLKKTLELQQNLMQELLNGSLKQSESDENAKLVSLNRGNIIDLKV